MPELGGLVDENDRSTIQTYAPVLFRSQLKTLVLMLEQVLFSLVLLVLAVPALQLKLVIIGMLVLEMLQKRRLCHKTLGWAKLAGNQVFAFLQATLPMLEQILDIQPVKTTQSTSKVRMGFGMLFVNVVRVSAERSRLLSTLDTGDQFHGTWPP